MALFSQSQKTPLSGVQYLGAFASLSLAVGQEAREEWQVDTVMQGQQEVICQLEARGILGPKLPNTVQEEQKDWSLQGKRRGNESDDKRRMKEMVKEMKENKKQKG